MNSITLQTQAIDNQMYDRLSRDWWDDHSILASLRYMLNPVRFGYFREVITERLRLDPQRRRVLDIGCGGGFLSEELARMGCEVSGIDLSEGTIDTARAHARASGLDIDYRVGSGERLPYPDASFDMVCCCDVLEHVSDLNLVLSEVSRVLRPGGLFLFDTINRTFMSNIFMIKIPQEWRLTRFIDTPAHVWRMFIKPKELEAAMGQNALEQRHVIGFGPVGNPLRLAWLYLRLFMKRISWRELGEKAPLGRVPFLSVNYMGYAVRR